MSDKITIRNGNSYWTGTAKEIVKWSKEKCYNNVQRERQIAASQWLLTEPAHSVVLDLLLALI